MNTNTDQHTTHASGRTGSDVHYTMEALAQMTKLWMSRGEYAEAKKFIAKAGDIFEMGDEAMKNIVRTIFVPSVSNILDMKDPGIFDLFPENLKNEYFRHVQHPVQKSARVS